MKNRIAFREALREALRKVLREFKFELKKMVETSANTAELSSVETGNIVDIKPL